MRLCVLIDYDNLLTPHKLGGMLDIVTKVLIQSPLNTPVTRGTCEIRVYGGWYEGPLMTQLAQDVAVCIRNEFPAIIRAPTTSGGSVGLTSTCELALALLQEPGHVLLNTYRKKGKPSNLRIQSPAIIGCADPACPLPTARKLIRHGRCPISTCVTTAADLVYRHEQKIVDTMLSCDLIYARQLAFDCLVLISGDDDFLPAIRTALLGGTPVWRVHPKAGYSHTKFPPGGASCLEFAL